MVRLGIVDSRTLYDSGLWFRTKLAYRCIFRKRIDKNSSNIFNKIYYYIWASTDPMSGPLDRSLVNVHRYTITDNVQEITLVMEWTVANQPVIFKHYNGRFTLETLPGSPDNIFTTTPDQNRFMPDSDCQRFHMNFWMANFGKAVNALNPGPSNGQPQDVVITNFQYQPINWRVA